MKPYGSEDRLSWCGCCGGGKSCAGIKVDSHGRFRKVKKAAKSRARQQGKQEINSSF